MRAWHPGAPPSASRCTGLLGVQEHPPQRRSQPMAHQRIRQLSRSGPVKLSHIRRPTFGKLVVEPMAQETESDSRARRRKDGADCHALTIAIARRILQQVRHHPLDLREVGTHRRQAGIDSHAELCPRLCRECRVDHLLDRALRQPRDRGVRLQL